MGIEVLYLLVLLLVERFVRGDFVKVDVENLDLRIHLTNLFLDGFLLILESRDVSHFDSGFDLLAKVLDTLFILLHNSVPIL